MIEVEDLDAALEWGRKIARRSSRLPIEVRPLQRVTVDVEHAFRAEHGRAVAVLVRVFGDIDVAEEAVQEAFAAALERWPVDGVPPSPAGWIITTARRTAIDRLRREASRDDRHAQAVLLAGSQPARPRRWAPCRTTACG